MRYKFGFTLAEVLITLGIIGIVAALTLPALIQKNHVTTVETRLKKFYSSINQAIQMAEVKYGDKQNWTPKDTDEFWNIYIKPYLKYTDVENVTAADSLGAKQYLVKLPDGSGFVMDIYFGVRANGEISEQTHGGHFIFCPQVKDCRSGLDYTIMGKKQFLFGYWPNEAIVDKNGKPYMKYHKGKGVEPYMAHWDGNEESLTDIDHYGCKAGSATAAFCTAVIQHNGWHIPKNYPFKF